MIKDVECLFFLSEKLLQLSIQKRTTNEIQNKSVKSQGSQIDYLLTLNTQDPAQQVKVVASKYHIYMSKKITFHCVFWILKTTSVQGEIGAQGRDVH